jgi:hypothetical protein
MQQAGGPSSVVETPMSRPEEFARPYALAEQSRAGLCSFSFPGKLAGGISQPPDVDLPPTYAPGAAFYPTQGELLATCLGARLGARCPFDSGCSDADEGSE